MAAEVEKKGAQAEAPDVYIAATALAKGFAVATGNTRHFVPMGVTIINPWKE